MTEGSMFSTLDYLCVAGVAGIAIYFFAFRKKKEEAPPAFKKLHVGPSALQRTASVDLGFLGRMKHGNRNIVCFYGSQTGTAEEFAARLAKDSARYGMKAIVADPEESEMNLYLIYQIASPDPQDQQAADPRRRKH